MIAEVDLGTATILAAVLVLIGTFVANTYATIRQERAQRNALVARNWQLHKALYSEMGFVVARFCNIIKTPTSDLKTLSYALGGVHPDVYNSIHKDAALFYGLSDADRIDRFYKWVSNAVSYGTCFHSDEDMSTASSADINAFLRLHLRNALKAVDILPVLEEATYVFLQEGSVGKDPRDCILELVREPQPEPLKPELIREIDSRQKQLFQLTRTEPAPKAGFWAKLFSRHKREKE